ncbi:MAG TPA: NUDIX hydrolase [Caulobacteraceae bacterium]|nr:NUDIX hydrolase [Caulobacteraceae bacterium]
MGKKARRLSAREPKNQSAALPWRLDDRGDVRVLLITSRETRRWVVPKGWPIKGLKGGDCAAREAFEEAGVVGEASRKPIGAFSYDKRLANGATQHVEVGLYPLKVTEEKDDWPEKGQREKLWASRAEAANLVDEPDLKRLLAEFAPE